MHGRIQKLFPMALATLCMWDCHNSLSNPSRSYRGILATVCGISGGEIMGYMRHHAIVVTSWSKKHISKSHRRARAIFEGVSPIITSVVNDYKSFFIPPDGSKSGWADSDQGNDRRDEFIEWMEQEINDIDGGNYLDWVEVQYGDDNEQTIIVRDSDAKFRDKA